MWCLVSQPNSVVLQIKVDPKAIGQDCLEKVCEFLGIGPEADYFGLKTSKTVPTTEAVDSNVCTGSDNEEEASGEWVNLRNPLVAQKPRLRLRVKFWVPPHRLLLTNTRHQFYLHARRDLIDGRMVVADWDVACRLVALIAQAESGDYDMDEPPTAIYNQCVNIGPQEEKPSDYIQRIIDYHYEIAGMKSSSAEYQLLKEISDMESFGEELFFCKPMNAHNNNDAHSLYCHLLYHNKASESEGMPNKYDDMYVSQTVGCLTTGGVQEGGVEGCGCKLGMCVGVGPQGINVYRPGNGIGENHEEKQSIPYTAIIRAAPLRRIFQLVYLNGEGHETMLNIKMHSPRIAAALYRAVTEKHAFYCCETVRSDVTKQFIRDLKGTIVSIFNEESTLGKKYVFDIRRTYTEVYDNARRALFVAGKGAGHHAEGSCSLNGHRRGSQCEADCREPRERGASQQMDALVCRVCMDDSMDTLFLPCRHVLCCAECASRCTHCPLCRSEIKEYLKIYLPIECSQKQ